MIKLEDNVSVVIICVITFMAIFYSFMFLGDNFAAAFMEGTGNPAPNEATLFWMGSWGFIYLSLAVGNIMALLVPASESRVYFRAMTFLAFVSLLRALGNTIIAEETLTYAPLIASFIVAIGFSVVLSRTKSRAGAHFGWL